MTTKPAPPLRSLIRSIAIGVLLSMLFFYWVHVFGKWEVENYRPDAETTSTVLLHNTCAIFGDTHTLRPNTGISAVSDGIDGTKFAGSFVNFTDGHIVFMAILALGLGGIIFIIRNWTKKNRQ